MHYNITLSKKVFNDVYIPFLDNDDRYLIFGGGGSSGKSYFIAQRTIYKMLKNKRCNVLITRQTGDTNRRSTFPLMKQVISQWKLTDRFKINESDMRIKCLINGNEIAFAGLDDVEKIKSITFENGELTDIWCEEATEMSESDINQLKVRLRGGKSKKQMVLSFNPINIQHWIKGHFIDSGLATVCWTTYKDNKFLSEDDKQALEAFKDIDEYYYEVYCLGHWGIVGKTVFDAKKLTQRLETIKKPVKVGYFEYEYDGIEISDIRFVNDSNGYIKIYKVPQYSNYAIGGDTAGEGSDYFTGHVLDAATGEQVAVLRQQFDEDLYTKQMYCLGMYYKEALMSIEANFSTYPNMELQRLEYPNLYIRTQMDSYTGKLEKRYGFKTTSLTRPTILAKLVEVVREHTELINDKDTIEELLTIVRNEKGRIEAPVGGHDDLMMGLAIAYNAIEQVSFSQEPIIMPGQLFFEEEDEPEVELDYGDEIEVI